MLWPALPHSNLKFSNLRIPKIEIPTSKIHHSYDFVSCSLYNICSIVSVIFSYFPQPGLPIGFLTRTSYRLDRFALPPSSPAPRVPWRLLALSCWGMDFCWVLPGSPRFPRDPLGSPGLPRFHRFPLFVRLFLFLFLFCTLHFCFRFVSAFALFLFFS